MNLVLRAGIAHLWFVTIHPFDDGNGRIARALSDMLLAAKLSSRHFSRVHSDTAETQQIALTYWGLPKENSG